jgi:hypothetical protein
MKNAIYFSLLLTATMLIVGCEKDSIKNLNKVYGTGEIVTKTLSLDSFSKIEHDGVANLYVSLGSPQSVTLKAQQNIIDVLTWEVSEGTLLIGTGENISIETHKEIRFEITVPELSSLLHDGVGDATLQGDLQNSLDIDFRGVGEVDAYSLPVNECLVLNSGVGDCKVMVNNYLEVDISSIGNVYYKGNPQISITDNGNGELINDN